MNELMFTVKEFYLEADELLNSATTSLKEMLKDKNFSSNFDNLYRVIHNLKGAANIYEIKLLEGHMESLEKILLKRKKANRPFKKKHIQFFLSAMEATRNILRGEYSEFHNLNAKALDQLSEKASPKESKRKSKGFPNLIIYSEDNKRLEKLKRTLTKEDFTVSTYKNSEKFLGEITKEIPDIIILDIDLSNDENLNLFKEVKEMGEEIQIIFLCQKITKQNLLESISYGAFALLEKPLNKKLLIKTCISAFRKSKALRLLDRSIHFILYQFKDLENYLVETDKAEMASALKTEIDQILSLRKNLYSRRHQPITTDEE